MDFGGLTLGDDVPKKERRFSVHDVTDDDNNISYGQIDNEAISNSSLRIASSLDSDQHLLKKSRTASNHSDDSDSNKVFIHETVDNNEDYDEYHDVATRGSKEHTPSDNNAYPSHYRHPSLAPNENPASDDDEDMDKDHGRYLSTLIHENVESLVCIFCDFAATFTATLQQQMQVIMR